MSDCKETVEASGPGGWKLRIFGANSMQIAGLILVGYFLWQSGREHGAIVQELTALRKEMGEQRNEIQIQTWMLSLPTEQRPQLIMPQGIEARLYSNDRRR